MGKFIDLTGHRYGRFTVVELVEPHITPKGKIRTQWKCLCDCGAERIVATCNLRNGTSRSCGCLSRELARKRLTKHGLAGTKIYYVWQKMCQGCFSPNSREYKYYGARGITVCDEWCNNFQAFYDWAIESGYKEEISPNGINKWTIERIDNDGNFEPDNCCWATMEAQANNKQTNHLVTFQGKTQTISRIAKQQNINPQLIYDRLKKDWEPEKAITTPPAPPEKQFEVKGEKLTLSELAQKYNIKYGSLVSRLHRGMSILEAIETPIGTRYSHKKEKHNDN